MALLDSHAALNALLALELVVNHQVKLSGELETTKLKDPIRLQSYTKKKTIPLITTTKLKV